MTYDIVIAGGSLSGLSAAVHSAGKGARVLLVECKPDVAEFRCAEGVLGEQMENAGFPPAREHVSCELGAFRLRSPGGLALDVGIRYKKMVMLDRGRFQTHLLGRARDAGCEVRTSVRARRLDLEKGTLELSAGGTVSGRVFMDATGTGAFLGRQHGVARLSPDEMSVVAQWKMEAHGPEEDRFQLLFGSPYHSPAGYAWIFPKGDGVFNIGVGGVASHVLRAGRPGELLERFIRENVPGAGRRLRYVASFLPSAPPLDRPVIRSTDGSRWLMMTGDAARLCTATVSAGIANALMSGRWAGEHWTEPEKYEEALRARLYPNLLRGFEFKAAHLSDGAMDRVFRRRLRPMVWLHRLVPGYIEQKTLDLLGW